MIIYQKFIKDFHPVDFIPVTVNNLTKEYQ